MKRSSQVALLLMGVTAVGATGYAMTAAAELRAARQPGRTAAPLRATRAEPCPPQRSWSSSSYGSRSTWTRTNCSSNSSVWPRPMSSRTARRRHPRPRSLTSRSSPSQHVVQHDHVAQRPATTTRGGFGSTGQLASSSGS